jgi:hypothetical protein
MTSGTLGIVTNSSSLPEVGGPPSITTYVQDPKSARSVASAIEKNLGMLEGERRERIRLATKWIERYGGGGSGGIGHGEHYIYIYIYLIS